MIFNRNLKIVTLESKAEYPYVKNFEIVQAKDKSASGVVHVESFNVQTNTLTFNFRNIVENDYQLILDFFINDAEGMLNVFNLTDDLGVTRTVRFTSHVLNFQLTSYNRWSGSFTVEEVS